MIIILTTNRGPYHPQRHCAIHARCIRRVWRRRNCQFIFTLVNRNGILTVLQFEALRRVHLIPSNADDIVEIDGVAVNVNVFRNLESPVSEGGENFSTGLALCQRHRVTLLTNFLARNSFYAWLEQS